MAAPERGLAQGGTKAESGLGFCAIGVHLSEAQSNIVDI